MTILAPGGTIGMLGGGQLGRMTTLAARVMGYRVVVLDPLPNSPAGQVANRHIVAPYDDEQAIAELGAAADVITLEFENLPVATVRRLAHRLPTRPGAEALNTCQDRLVERRFLQRLGAPTAPFAAMADEASRIAAGAAVPFPAVLKTATQGYDSKGQRRVATAADLSTAHAELGGVPCILEELLRFDREISVIVARDVEGRMVTYDPADNHHVDGILDTSSVPAAISASQAAAARDLAMAIARELELVGVLAVELFVLPDGRLLVNELAPRPHNSGHWSIEACRTSQFEHHARTVVGAPVGPTDLLAPAATTNLLGDLWAEGTPRWDRVLALPEVKLHLYGKDAPRRGRKMGHLTALGPNAEAARERVLAARALLVDR
ncbi:MAG TPA: 5-(carboxyamino)imidazole ribonucleotide synthase [Chloroflexota bacterium]|jgi:5-(carboxyamino)imidazole ribonucleotide synthase